MVKNAEMSINMIVAAALALIVLVILLFIFKAQIGNISGGFFTVGNDAKYGASGTKCKAMLTDRTCGATPPPGYSIVQPALPKPCKTYKIDLTTKKPTQECDKFGWADCGEAECYEITKT